MVLVKINTPVHYHVKKYRICKNKICQGPGTLFDGNMVVSAGILRVPYTDRITNDQILDRAGVPDIEMIVRKMQLRWAGHVARMSDDRIPKQLLFGELTTGARTVGRPLLRWKDSLKDTETIKHFHNEMARHRN